MFRSVRFAWKLSVPSRTVIIAHLVKKYPDLCDTCMFIDVFTRARHCVLNQMNPVHTVTVYSLISVKKFTNYLNPVVINNIMSTLVPNFCFKTSFLLTFVLKSHKQLHVCYNYVCGIDRIRALIFHKLILFVITFILSSGLHVQKNATSATPLYVIYDDIFSLTKSTLLIANLIPLYKRQPVTER